jgi:hypothetical protein
VDVVVAVEKCAVLMALTRIISLLDEDEQDEWCHRLNRRRLQRILLDHERRCYYGLKGTQQQPHPSGVLALRC